MTTLIALAISLAAQSGELEHMKPEVRLLGAKLAGELRTPTAVGPLIRRLEDANEKPEVKAAAQEALARITDRTDLKDAAAWRAWYNREGHTAFPETTLTQDQINDQIDTRTRELLAIAITRSEERVDTAKKDVRIMAISMAVAIFLFLIVMIFFVGNVSSKIKGWRELVSRAEVYIKQSQQITERTDKVVAELDAKKAELVAFVAKLREENEAGIERFGDMLGKNLEHTMREQLQALRQRAEKELEQTLTDLKTQLEIESRRVAAEMRNRMTK